MGMLLELALKGAGKVEQQLSALSDPSSEAELRRLVNEVADADGFSPEVRAEALAADALPDPRAEVRRQRVLAMLEAHPTARYAVVTDEDADPQAVILTLAIRRQVTFALRIPKDRYDPFLLLDLIERHGATVQ